MGQHTFVFSQQGHTLGNLVRARLVEAGHHVSYRVPHPLSENVEISIESESIEQAWEYIKIASAAISKDFERLGQNLSTSLSTEKYIESEKLKVVLK